MVSAAPMLTISMDVSMQEKTTTHDQSWNRIHECVLSRRTAVKNKQTFHSVNKRKLIYLFVTSFEEKLYLIARVNGVYMYM